MERHSLNPDEGLYEALHRATLSKFLPSVIREAFEEKLFEMQIKPNQRLHQLDSNWNISAQTISNENQNARDVIMIPETLFYDNEQVIIFINASYLIYKKM